MIGRAMRQIHSGIWQSRMRNRRLNQHVFGDQLHRAWALTGRTELSFDTRCSLPLLNTQAAKARGVKLGGTNAQSIANRSEANKHAKKLRPILTELAGLSAYKAAAELNQRGVATPQGGQWHALTVVRVRQRLAAMT
jgi:hypothetical protein